MLIIGSIICMQFVRAMVTLVFVLVFSNLPSCSKNLVNLIILVTKGSIIRKADSSYMQGNILIIVPDLNKVKQRRVLEVLLKVNRFSFN